MTCSVVTIAQQKGGSGKTNVALNLAVCLYKRGRKVTIIDVDPQGTLSEWYEIRKAQLGEKEGFQHSHISGWRVHSDINLYKNTSDVIIIDSPPHTEAETKTVIRAADLVLMPAQPSPADLWATHATIELVNQERIPYRVVLNRMLSNSTLAESFAAKFPCQLESRIGNRIAFMAAMARGKSVVETRPYSKAADEVNALTTEVEDLVFGAELESYPPQFRMVG